MSRAKLQETAKNPIGFSERLRFLMEGWGYSIRDVGERADVSHQTVANWLAGSSRAGRDDVQRVAEIFGWTAAELYDGEPRRDVMTHYAELAGFRMKARRLAAEIAGTNVQTIDAAAFVPVPKRSSAQG